MQVPGKHVILELDLKDLGEPFLQRRIHDGHHGLHSPIEVAGHEVRRPEVELGRVAVRAESKDSRVLEETAHQRSDSDSLRKTGHAGAQAAETADDQIDLRPGL